VRKISTRGATASDVLPWIIYLMGGQIPQCELASRGKDKPIGYVRSHRKFLSSAR
jgi:hypothetical protein